MGIELTELYQVRVASSLDSLARVESLVDEVCKELSLSEDVYGNVLIAVTEAVNNAIIHGNKFSEDKLVGLGVFLSPTQVCFQVSDQGDGFDFLNLPDPTAPENIEKENGRGIFLINNLADEVSFDRSGSEIAIFFNR